ncbi:MAG: rubredoxin [Eubacterium sp.]|nr:rubredoxin [Eubacterium sp.]
MNTASDSNLSRLPEDWKCPRCRQGKERFNRA